MSDQSNISQVNTTHTHGEHDCCKQYSGNSNYEPSNKTISIKESTLKKLRTYGTYGSTLDSILRYLIDRVEVLSISMIDRVEVPNYLGLTLIILVMIRKGRLILYWM